MAKKDHALDDYEDLNFDDEFGFDEFGDGGEDPNSSPRKPSSKIRSKLKESARAKYEDAKFRREVLKASLPSDYSSVLEDYDAVSKEVGDVWRDQQKQWEKHRSGVKRAIRPYSDVISKLGFKKLEAWANEEDRVSSGTPSDDEIDELKVQSIMADVFGDIQDQQTQHLTQLETARQEREDERYAEDVAEREVSAKRSIEGNNYLASINSGITTIADYTNKIDFQYKKRSLELQARLLITQQRALTTLNSFRDSAIKELQDIHKNTALPDYLKINTDEMITKAFKEKFAENFTAPWTGVGSQFSKRIFGQVKKKMAGYWEDLGLAISGANDANEGFQDGMGGDGTAWGGLKDLGLGLGTDAIINKPAKFLQDKVAPKIRDYLSKHHGINVQGSNLKTMGSNFAAMFNEALKSGETGFKSLDAIVNFFDLQEAAMGEKNTLWDKNELDLEKAVYMDNRFKLSVTDVIPGWLKKIYGQVFGLNNQGKEAPDLSWDFKAEGFVRTEDQDRETLEGMVSKESLLKQKQAIEKWIDVLGDGMSFTPKTREWLSRWVKKKLRSSDAIDPILLLADGLSAPKDVRAELEKVIQASYQLTDKQVELAKGGKLKDLHNVIKEGNIYANNRLNKTADAAYDARKQVRSFETDVIAKLVSSPEGRRALIRSGVAFDNGKGQFQYNYKIDDMMQDQLEYVRERDTRIGGKRVNDRVGPYVGRRSRNEDRRGFLSDDGREEILDKLGYGEYEAKMKKDAQFGWGFESLGFNDEKKLEREILRSLSTLPDPKMHPGYGRDFFFTRAGKLITRANKAFLILRKKEAPELANEHSYAAGGRIPSFASGGDNKLKSGVTEGQPGDENLVKTHGGEFVVNHDAAKFNVKLLGAINKYGAPLINADGSINSVYHKVFGFDKAKDFTKQAGKDFAVGAKNIKNEQAEIAIKHILNQMNPIYVDHYDKVAAELTDAKISPEKRLAKGLQHWTKYQKAVLKHQGVKAYGKGAARKGMQFLSDKFDQLIDTDNTGTNIEIKNKLMNGGRNLGRGLYNNVTNYASDLRDKAKTKMLDRDNTMGAISKTLAEVENPKRFNQPLDLYFKGKGSPFLTKKGFNNSDYIDQNTGAVIRNPSEITGTVVDREGQIVVSIEEMFDNDIVTRARKPYRLLGLEQEHRKYFTTTEYVANRYSVIAQSKRFQDTLAKGKEFRDKWLRDEAIDCYLRSDLVTPVLRATDFKAGNYIDKETGNVLWTHHDITGAVTDKENKEILSAEQIADGLFTDKGEHIKINKFKRMRNTVFKRGNEVYNRYAAKHVNKYKDLALNAMSNMGEAKVGLNFDKNPIDVYVKGEKNPRITFAMFKSGKMMDVKSGKPILSHSGIQGPVISAADSTGNQLITEEDIKTGLVDAMGEDLYLPKMQTAMKRFTNYLKEAVLPKSKFGAIRNFINLSPEKRMEKMNELIDKYGVAFDVYVKGEPLTPKLTKAGFEGSKYISQKTGLAIKLPDFIDGPVLDLEGNVILSAEEIEKGLLTIDGKKVKIGVDLKNGGLFNNIAGTASIFGRISGKRDMLLRGMGMGDKAPEPEEEKTERNVLYTIKFKNKKGMPLSPEAARINNRMFTQADVKGGMLIRVDYTDGKSSTEVIDDVENIDASTWLKSAMSNKITDGINFGAVFTMGGYIIDDEGKVIKTTFHTGKKKAKPVKLDATGAMPLKGMFGSAFDKMLDKFGIKSRLGSWQQQREDKANKKDGDPKNEEKKEKKDSWIGKLIKKLTLPLTAMFGGLASGIGALKASLLGGLAWLGQSVVQGKLMGSLGAFMGRSGLGRALAVGAVTYGGIKAFNYLDGDGSGASSYGAADQNAQYANLDTTSKVLHMGDSKAPETTSGKGFLETMASNPELASALAMGAMMMPGGLKTIGKGALAVGKGAWKYGGKVLHWGGKKLGKLAGRTATAAGGAAARNAPGLLGKAGRVLGGAWRMTGGGVGMAARAAPLLAGLGGLLLPAALIAGAAVGGYMIGKGLMKLWNNHKNPWNRFRMAQYGFNHNNEELMNKIAQIEGIATNLISINGDGQPSVKTDEKAMIEILKICGIYDKDGKMVEGQEQRLQSFAIWFKERFLRVYSSYLRCLKKMRGKAEMVDLQTLNRQEQLKLLDETHFKSLTLSPYVVTNSPFEDPAETNMDATDVDVIYRKLKNKIETSKDIKDGEVKDYSKIKNEDGLEDKTAKPLSKNATAEDKLKAEMDKQLDKTNPLKQDAKTMVDKANEAVKYQTDAANLLTKTHNAQIRSATEQATKETEKQFEKSSTSLMDKLKSGLSSMANVVSNSFVGDAASGAVNAWNTVGMGIDSGLSQAGNAIAGWLGDGKGLGGSGKWSKGKRDDLFPSISAASKKYGLNERTMLTMAYIESKGDPNASNPSGAKGIYQFIPATAKAYGLGNPYDQAANIDAGMRLTRDGIAYFKKKVGREPEPYEIYLMHQQGQGGLSIIAAAAAKGGTVPANIQKNVDSNAPQKGMTPAAFLAYWKQRYNESDLAVHGNGGGGASQAAAPSGTSTAKPAAGTPKASANTPGYLLTGGTNKAPAANAGGGGGGGGGGVAPAAKVKEKVFFGDSIADGYKNYHKGSGWTKVGADPKTVLFYLSNTVLKNPSKYRDKDVYLSTGISNNPTDSLSIATQLQRLKDLGVKVKVFGISNQYPKGNPLALNTLLATLCKRFGHTFLGGFNAGKDKVHPATYATLPGGGSAAASKAPAKATPAKAGTAASTGSASANTPGHLLTGGAKPLANAAVAPQISNSVNVAGSADWDFDKIVKAVLNNKLPKASGKCAEYVRKALVAGDLRGKIQKTFGGKLGHAFEYLARLPKLGFNRVYSGQQLKGFQLMKGDVVVFDKGVYGSDNKSGGGWVYGHVAIWTGGNWVSDFIQSSIYPHSKYASPGIPFTIFRANGIAKEKVVDCKFPGDEDFGQPLLQSTPTNAAQAKRQEQATQISPSADKVNNTVNNLNNGGVTSAVPVSPPQPTSPMEQMGGGDVINLLGKQLNVQEQILSVLKDIAKGSLSNTTGVDANAKPGVTTPNMSAIRNEKSPFSGVKNPVSVLKPV